MKRLASIVAAAAAACVCGLASPARADSFECDGFRGDERILPGEVLGNKGWKRRELPSKGDVDDALSSLDSHDEGPLAYAIDLNRDGRPELLLASPGDRLCGNGGCPYVLLDPKTLKRIGDFFGHQLAFLDERVNGYRVIQSWSRYLAGISNLDTYVFDRGAYRLVSHALVDACGLEQWQRRMRVPK